MRPNLITIDYGNTNPHLGFFKNKILEKVIPITDLKKIESVQNIPAIISCVSTGPKHIDNLKHLTSVSSFKKNGYFLDMPFNYTDSIGEDRLTIAHFVFNTFTKNNSAKKVLAIDAGTFITMDLISPDKGLEGGYIFQGVNTYLAGYNKGALLPSLESHGKNIDTKKVPHNTEEAILSASSIYVQSIMAFVIKQHAPDLIFITGGSCELVGQIIKDLNLNVEIKTEAHALHYALREIYALTLD